MMAQVTRLKGQNAKLWAPLDEAKLSNAKNLYDHFVARYDDKKICAIGAVSWYITLVTNTKVYPTPPNSWKELWNPANKGKVAFYDVKKKPDGEKDYEEVFPNEKYDLKERKKVK